MYELPRSDLVEIANLNNQPYEFERDSFRSTNPLDINSYASILEDFPENTNSGQGKIHYDFYDNIGKTLNSETVKNIYGTFSNA